jgi:hypothetical protein
MAATKQYLSKDGLLYFWQKLKATFVTDITYNSSTNKLSKTKNGSTTELIGLATDSTAGLMSANDKNTLDNIVSTGGEPNQNAWSNIKVGSTTVAADSKTDTFELTAGSNITLTPDTTNDKITIAATDTTYSDVTTSAHGLMTAADKVKLDKLTFDSNNLIDSSCLPSYVDDVIEAYPRTNQTELSSAWLATGSASGTAITPESGKIYVLMADSTSYAANTQFRWGGTSYVKLADGGVSNITNTEIDTIVAS